MEIPVDLSRIMITETADAQIIILKESGGERSFPIVIGFFEAAAIDRGVKRIQAPRPLTHDLIANVIKAMGGTVKKVVVTALMNHTFFAKLVIDSNGQAIEVDSRPSDAIALAAAQDIPIFVEEEVLDEVCSPRTDTETDLD